MERTEVGPGLVLVGKVDDFFLSLRECVRAVDMSDPVVVENLGLQRVSANCSWTYGSSGGSRPHASLTIRRAGKLLYVLICDLK